jgi:hypothetical protein
VHPLFWLAALADEVGVDVDVDAEATPFGVVEFFKDQKREARVPISPTRHTSKRTNITLPRKKAAIYFCSP